jgi:hypothetical protein
MVEDALADFCWTAGYANVTFHPAHTSTQLNGLQATVFLLLVVKHRIPDADLPAHLLHSGAEFGVLH